MLKVVFANRANSLVDSLAERIASERLRRGLFEPITLIVPNRSVEAYVRFALAERLGVIANLRAWFLGRFVEATLASAAPELLVLQDSRLRGLVLDLLHSDARLRGDAALAPVHAYLHTDEQPHARERRRVQLADALAQLFGEYQLWRPDVDALLADARQGTAHTAAHVTADHRATARWQHALWQALQALARERARKGEPHALPLHMCLERVARAAWRTPAQVHLFGFSHLPPAHMRFVEALAEKTDLVAYHVNPCREFWEDLRTRPARSEDTARGLEAEPPLLHAFARPVRESVTAFSALAQYDVEERYVEPLALGDTLLARLQSDTLARRAPAVRDRDEGLRLGSDGSIRVLAAPSARREIECVAAEIVRWLQADAERPTRGSPLRLSDLALVLPASRFDAYLPHLSALREAYDLPHAVVDVPLSRTSRAVEAALLLLALPTTRLTREDLLAFLSHPASAAAARLGDARAWALACADVGIISGADRDDWAGTYVDRDLLSWTQGLRRIALGAFMEGASEGVTSPARLGDVEYLPAPAGTSDAMRERMALALGAQALLAEAVRARDAELPLRLFAERFIALIDVYVNASDAHEARALNRVRAALSELGELNVGEHRVTYTLAAALATDALAGLRTGRGQPLADGLTVSTFMPMRPVPFRGIFLAGLTEGDFPSPVAPNPLDVRAASPRSSDVSPRERDRAMFLEAVTSATERLHVSYVARDEVTGDERAASQVVLELEELLRRGYVGDAGLSALRAAPPLWRDEDAACVAGLPAAREEALARKLGERSRAEHPEVPPGEVEALLSALPETRARAYASLLGCVPTIEAQRAAKTSERVQVFALQRFLACPLQGHALYRLGLSELVEEDLSAVREEPHSTPWLIAMRAARDAFTEALRTGDLDSVRACERFDAILAVHEQRAEAPTGPLGLIERAVHHERLHRWAALASDAFDAARARTVRLGPASEHAREVDAVAPALTLTGLDDATTIEVHGLMAPRIRHAGRDHMVLLADRRASHGVAGGDEREVLRAFVELAVMRAADLDGGAALSVTLLNTQEPKPLTFHLEALSVQDARAFLTDLSRALLFETHSYLLPCEAVLKYLAEGGALREHVDELRERDQGFSSTRGPIRDALRYDAPDEDTARAMVAQRFGLFARVWTRPEKKR